MCDIYDTGKRKKLQSLAAKTSISSIVAAAQESQRNPTSRPGSRVLRRPGSSLGCYRLTLA